MTAFGTLHRIVSGVRFELECWQMDDGSVAIFQIFADNGGFMKYVPEK